MNKALMTSVLVVALLLAGSAYAFTQEIVPSKTYVVYPEDKTVDVTIVLEKELLDKLDTIEDISYKFSVDGSAEIDGSGKSVTGTVASLEDKYSKKITLNLEDTSSAKTEYITLTLDGEYVKTSVIGGGKKDFSVSSRIGIISTDKSKVVAEKEAIEEEYLKCLDDKEKAENELSGIMPEITQLRAENKALQANNTALTKQLDTKCPSYDRLNLILILTVAVLLSVIISLAWWMIKRRKGGSGKQKHKVFSEDDF